MNAEGIGIKAPSPHKVILTDHDMRCIVHEAKKRAAAKYANATDRWSCGQKPPIHIRNVGKITSTERPIVAGLLGEHVVSRLIKKRHGSGVAALDLAIRRYGDGGIDLQAFGERIQVKTRQSPKHGNLVRRVCHSGFVVPINASYFVFCEWSGSMSVSILGCISAALVLELPLVPGVSGHWQNAVVDDRLLEPFGRLLDNIAARKELL